MKPDPIFAAIKEARSLFNIWQRLYDPLNVAEWEAEKKHGRRPCFLIAWRDHSAIGGSEIDEARKRFLREGVAPPEEIEKEYLAAKARERAGRRAGIAWDKRAGIAAQSREFDNAIDAERRAHIRMAKTRPTTPAGAAAMLAYIKADMDGGGIGWHDTGIATLVTTLKAWGKGVPR